MHCFVNTSTTTTCMSSEVSPALKCKMSPTLGFADCSGINQRAQLHFVCFQSRGVMSATRFGSFVFTSLVWLRVLFYLCYFWLFPYTDVQHGSHIKWCSCCLRAERRFPLVEHTKNTWVKLYLVGFLMFNYQFSA